MLYGWNISKCKNADSTEMFAVCQGYYSQFILSFYDSLHCKTNCLILHDNIPIGFTCHYSN